MQHLDGSVYHPPETRRAQVLQYIESIPVPVSICQVKLRISVGYCGGIGSAYNFMHASFEKHGAYIRTTKAACHQSSPDGTLQIDFHTLLWQYSEGRLGDAPGRRTGRSFIPTRRLQSPEQLLFRRIVSAPF